MQWSVFCPVTGGKQSSSENQECHLHSSRPMFRRPGPYSDGVLRGMATLLCLLFPAESLAPRTHHAPLQQQVNIGPYSRLQSQADGCLALLCFACLSSGSLWCQLLPWTLAPRTGAGRKGAAPGPLKKLVKKHLIQIHTGVGGKLHKKMGWCL